MADLIHNYDFEPCRQGATYDRVTFEFAAEDINFLGGASIFMQLRKQPDSISVAEFSTENDKLTILSDYSFCLNEQVINVTPDNYWYDILVVFADGRRDFPLGGKWSITNTITHKK